MFRSRILIATGALAGLLALPVPAPADPVELSAAARLEASANLNAGWAATAASRSPGTARRLLRTSRQQLSQAQRITLARVRDTSVDRDAAVASARRFSASVRRNSDRVRRLMRRSSSRLERESARALEANAAMQAEVAVAVAGSGQGLSAPEQSQVAYGTSDLADRQAELTRSLLTALGTEAVAARARRHLECAVARGLEAQSRISAALTELHAGAQAQASDAVAAASAHVAQIVRDLHALVTGSHSASAQVDTGNGERSSLAEASSRAAARTQADAESTGGARVQAGAEAQTSIGVKPLS